MTTAPTFPRDRTALTPYAVLLPALAITAAVVVFPVLQTAWLSLHDYIIYRPQDSTFVGLRNFTALLTDEVF